MNESLIDFCTSNALPMASTGVPRYLWVDLETTGLDNDRDVILEMGVLVTDNAGNVCPGMNWDSLIWEPSDHYRERWDAMLADDFLNDMHTKSGLLDEITAAEDDQLKSIGAAQRDVLAMLKDHEVEPNQLYLAGSSIHFDNGFMEHYMHGLAQFVHYRQMNVSTLKILCQELNPELYESIQGATTPKKLHRSMSDLADSLHEFYMYAENFLFLPGEE